MEYSENQFPGITVEITILNTPVLLKFTNNTSKQFEGNTNYFKYFSACFPFKYFNILLL